jgi:hypothetical protein
MDYHTLDFWSKQVLEQDRFFEQGFCINCSPEETEDNRITRKDVTNFLKEILRVIEVSDDNGGTPSSFTSKQLVVHQSN